MPVTQSTDVVETSNHVQWNCLEKLVYGHIRVIFDPIAPLGPNLGLGHFPIMLIISKTKSTTHIFYFTFILKSYLGYPKIPEIFFFGKAVFL